MQIQNNLVISGGSKFQFINDGRFYLNPVTSKKKETAPKIIPDNINHFAVNLMLIESQFGAVLVDLGVGTLPNAIFKWADNSRHNSLIDKIKKINSAKLKAILFSHLHIDHIGNYLEFNGSAFTENFPDVPCYVSRLEWEFRTSRIGKADEIYKKYYHALERNLHLTEDDQEALPGIITKYIGGHTPGHQIILFRTKENTICYSGDLIATEAQLYKNRSLPFDFDPEYSMKLREKVLLEGRENQWIFAMNHAPHVNFKLLEKTVKNQ